MNAGPSWYLPCKKEIFCCDHIFLKRLMCADPAPFTRFSIWNTDDRTISAKEYFAVGVGAYFVVAALFSHDL
jgi:hypothetical protein